MSKTLALDKDGNLSYCSVPEEMRGTNGCPHVGHINKGESTKDFIERVTEPYVEPQTDDTWDKIKGGGAFRQREDGYVDFKHPDGRYEVTNIETAGEMAAEYELQAVKAQAITEFLGDLTKELEHKVIPNLPEDRKMEHLITYLRNKQLLMRNYL